MKRIIIPISCALLLPLTGCLDESSSGGNRTIFKVDENAQRAQSARYGYGSEEGEDGRKVKKLKPGEPGSEELAANPDQPGDGTVPTVENPESTGTPITEVTETTEPPKPDAPSGAGIPVATMIPGRPGLVYSPFAKGKPCDVTGYPPGTVMRCPHTGKEFKVP